MVTSTSEKSVAAGVSVTPRKCFFSMLGGAIAATSLAAVSAPAVAFTFGTTNLTDPVGNPGIFNSLTTVGITTDDIGDSFDIDWFLDADDAPGLSTDLSATATFTVNDLTSDLLTLAVDLTNTTDGGFQAAILALGLGVSPDATVNFAAGGEGSLFDDVGY